MPDRPLDAILDHLTACAGLERTVIERAQRLCGETGEPLHLGLVKLGIVAERQMTLALSHCLDLPIVRPEDYPEIPLPLRRVSPTFLRHARLVPLRADNGTLDLAMADPLDPDAPRALAVATGLATRVLVGVPAELEAALERLYGREGAEAGAAPAPSHAGSHEEDLQRLKDMASEAPVIRLVNQLVARAVECRASDIHFETFRAGMQVRYRVDGEMIEAEAPPAELSGAIVSRIKIMAHLDIAERRLPQDGRTKLPIRGRELDFRVSVLPTMHGESVVLRVLDRAGLDLDFATLGFGAAPLERWRGALSQPSGILLLTGPTGSGKTSTLYASMLELSSPRRKVVTVEDPIEYELAGVNQVQTRSQIGLDFANVLRSILRHDPDIIMVGEIRDRETAAMAVQAALTGHLVLTTLHTNNAASAPPRLLDMGVEDFLLASTLHAIGAQRLIRRLCMHCREPYQPLPELAAQVGLDGTVADGGRLYRPRGCGQCGNTGFFGRIAVVEVMTMSDRLRRLILKRAEAGEIHEAALAEGMRTMFQDALDKVAAGVTSLEEALRVAQLG
ncbi:MAG: GspE/PulE family protein [Geminicoccaceae bacterium]